MRASGVQPVIGGLRPTAPVALPVEIASAVESLRQAVLTRVASIPPERRLDLDDPAALDLLDAVTGGERELPTFEAIISVVTLPRFADVDVVARGVYRLLEPGGVVHLVEPVAHIGTTARLRATLWSANPETRRYHLERDVPFAFRSNDLLITDLERITMPTRTWPLRRFIDARARREAPFGVLPGDEASALDLQEARR